MEKNEIKKLLYKEKPIAKFSTTDVTMNGIFKYYIANTSQGLVQFKVPLSEMGEKEFGKEEPAQLLIRWIV